MPVAIRDFEVLPAAAPAPDATPAAPPRPAAPGETAQREALRRLLVRLAVRATRLGDR